MIDVEKQSDEPIDQIVGRYLANLIESGMNVSFCVLFGSHVSDRATDLSDIDVLVVSKEFDQPFGRSAIDHLWRVAARTDSRIEPIPVGMKIYSEPVGVSAVIEEARRTGMVIKPHRASRTTPKPIPALEPTV